MAFIYTNYANTVPFSAKHKYVPLNTPGSSFRATVLKRSKTSSLMRVSNFAATSGAESSVNGAAARRRLTATSKTERRALQSGKSSSAMEQLDIERGVCVPFRKYSPETVRFFGSK